MDSRLIYESSKTFESNVNWTRKQNAESDWHYFDLTQSDIIEFIINDFFIADTLYISIGRQDSCTLDKSEVYGKIKPFLGKMDFKIWNESFTKVIELNKIGVYRTGYVSR